MHRDASMSKTYVLVNSEIQLNVLVVPAIYRKYEIT